MSNAPAGWYPFVDGHLQYWKGSEWVATAPLLQSPTTPVTPTVGVMTPGKIALVAAAVAVVGSFLSCATIVSIFGTITVSGFDAGDGKLTGRSRSAALLFGYAGMSNRRTALTLLALRASAAGTVVAISDFVDISNKIGETDTTEYAHVSIGYGLYACVLGFGVATAGFGRAIRRMKWRSTNEEVRHVIWPRSGSRPVSARSSVGAMGCAFSGEGAVTTAHTRLGPPEVPTALPIDVYPAHVDDPQPAFRGASPRRDPRRAGAFAAARDRAASKLFEHLRCERDRHEAIGLP